jgi:hypothetical protein
MLWEHALIAYVVIGVLTASITMYVFPPMEGFRPPITMVVAGFLVFLLLWPVLALLALWYQTVSYFDRRSPRTEKSVGPTELAPSNTGELPMPTKPR